MSIFKSKKDKIPLRQLMIKGMLFIPGKSKYNFVQRKLEQRFIDNSFTNNQTSSQGYAGTYSSLHPSPGSDRRSMDTTVEITHYWKYAESEFFVGHLLISTNIVLYKHVSSHIETWTMLIDKRVILGNIFWHKYELSILSKTAADPRPCTSYGVRIHLTHH